MGKFESRKFAALDLVSKDLEGARYRPLPCLISWRIVREESIVFGTVNQGEENWLLITAVGNFKIVNGTSGRVLGMIGGDLSLLWW